MSRISVDLRNAISGGRRVQAGSVLNRAQQDIFNKIVAGEPVQVVGPPGFFNNVISAAKAERKRLLEGGGTAGSSPSQPQTFEDALAEANQANETRFQEALKLNDRQLQNLEGVGTAQRTFLERERKREQADSIQSFIDRGLFNSTLLDSNRRDIDERFNFQSGALDESLALLRNAVLGDRIGLLERKVDQAPDPRLFADLVNQAASAPSPSVFGGSTGLGTSTQDLINAAGQGGGANDQQAALNSQLSSLNRQRNELLQRLSVAQTAFDRIPIRTEVNPTTGRPNTALIEARANLERIQSQIQGLDSQIGQLSPGTRLTTPTINTATARQIPSAPTSPTNPGRTSIPARPATPTPRGFGERDRLLATIAGSARGRQIITELRGRFGNDDNIPLSQLRSIAANDRVTSQSTSGSANRSVPAPSRSTGTSVRRLDPNNRNELRANIPEGRVNELINRFGSFGQIPLNVLQSEVQRFRRGGR